MWHFSIAFLLLTVLSWPKKAAYTIFCQIYVLSYFGLAFALNRAWLSNNLCVGVGVASAVSRRCKKKEGETKMAAPVPAPAAKASAMSQLRIQSNEGKLEGLAALTAAVIIVALFLIAVSLGLNNQLVP